ncbi:polysialyltransferase family glycosyltransferase [Microbacterium sp.]|uniref:polysialyltransferase family glycosyltransferase n=1 Tax=Microbacterium sp. TaxID=51671 RepID=UPI0026324B9E|nr:polysialyltransferase family glycosyltransferase [Microbacterium sp.]
MTQIFALHSAYAVAVAVAAIDSGLIASNAERLLVPFNTAQVPETTIGIDELPTLASLRARFDRCEGLDAVVAPLHPSDWAPGEADLPMLARLFARAWNLDDDLELFVQSPQVAPAGTLLSLFPHAKITIIGDGLMTYSPIRNDLGRAVVERIGRVVYADVVPGVEPLVFTEAGAARVPVDPAAVRRVLAETATADLQLDDLADGTRTALVLGQYLAALGLISTDEEIRMQQQMVDRAAEWNPRRIVFKPHPSAPPSVTDAVRQRAEQHGAQFAQYRGTQSAELVAERLDVVGVVAGFSTALPTVHTLYGRPIAAVGTARMLRQLTPFENSNRIPLTIVDALTRENSPYRDPERLQLLIDAVGYAMQPVNAEHLRPRAEELLATLPAPERTRYFSPARLARLRLPGAPPPRFVDRMLRTGGGVGRMEELRLTIGGAQRRAVRAWKAVRGS